MRTRAGRLTQVCRVDWRSSGSAVWPLQSVLRADSAYYSPDVIGAVLRHGARFSITARQDSAAGKAIATICPMPGDDQLHRRGLRRRPAALDLRRSGHRDSPPRFHQQGQGQPPYRPADRAPGQGHEPRPPKRAVHRLPLPRPAGAPAVRALRGQQRLAGLRDDGVQPHPRRWRSDPSSTPAQRPARSAASSSPSQAASPAPHAG